MTYFNDTISRSWLITQVKKHRAKLLFANFIAVVATLISVPIPLLMPLMVDEVLLNHPAKGVEVMNQFLPQGWQTATGYIMLTLLMVVVMRIASQLLNIPAGKKVALVGASGGGKSTLIQLLIGVYRAQSGAIRFNGQHCDDISFDVIRNQIAVVLQQPILFNDTLRHNLTLGGQFSDDALWQALDIAQLQDVITKLDQGLESQIGRNGIRLSGGQRQRLAIARMVLSNPKFVILDEATSALDTATEAALHLALSKFLHGRTTLIVAHRLSAVKQADLIYVLEDGHVSQSGTHHELLEQEGLYQTLYGSVQSQH
ncbi:TPA: ATP-binding cassette domain-containing protein [Vibrio cholerae]